MRRICLGKRSSLLMSTELLDLPALGLQRFTAGTDGLVLRL
jgi:hypothetical protein